MVRGRTYLVGMSSLDFRSMEPGLVQSDSTVLTDDYIQSKFFMDSYLGTAVDCVMSLSYIAFTLSDAMSCSD
jgi:hypothetical protein